MSLGIRSATVWRRPDTGGGVEDPSDSATFPIATTAIVPMNVSPIVRFAPQLPPVVPTTAAPIVSMAPPLAPSLTPFTGSPVITRSAPMSLILPNTGIVYNAAPIGGGPAVPMPGGILGGANSILDLISKGMSIFKGGSSTGLGGGPSSGSPTVAQPSSGPGVNQSGLGTDIAIGVAGGAVGELINYLMHSGSSSGGGLTPRGYHPNKVLTRYAVAKANGHKVQDPTKEPRVKNALVRNRSMNALNPRALSRANHRVHSFSRIARKALHHMGYTVARTRSARAGGKRKKR